MIMTDPILDKLKAYFENTPREQVEKVNKELSEWSKIGQSVTEFLNENIMKTPTFLNYFKEGYEAHYWREATYHPNDGWLDDKYILKDLHRSVIMYKEQYGLDVSSDERREAYDNIKQMIKEIIV